MIIIQEGKLQFEFSSDWQVCKYDGENHFYHNQVCRCQGTKAVDILASSGTELFMIEAKDFRGDRINNKERIIKGELVIEVAQKVRDTIAGLYGAYRCFNDELQPFYNQLFYGKRQPVKVVLLLEEDIYSGKIKSLKQKRSALAKALHKQLKFLGVHCHVHSCSDLPVHFQWRVKSIVAVMVRYYSNGVDRQRLESHVCEILQFPESRKPFVVSRIDRMLQSQQLFSKQKLLFLETKLFDAELAMQQLRDNEWDSLKKKIEIFVNDKMQGYKGIDLNSLESLMENLGALILETAKETSSSIGQPKSAFHLNNTIQERLRQLHATLDMIGFPEGLKRDQALEKLAQIASNSRIGQQMMAGELFISLSAFDTPFLIRALGGHSGIEVLLDASVAIPILCALLYEPSFHRFGFATSHMYRQLKTHEISVLLPLDYLQEVATHLILALNYQYIIKDEPDLIGSENAFVAHYTSLYINNKIGSFIDYIEGFGLDKSLRGANFERARNNLMPKLQRYFELYGIKTKPLGKPSKAAKKHAEEAIGFLINQKTYKRASVVIDHDKRTTAYLFDQDRTTDIANVLCTWDNLHFQIRENEDVMWDVLNPVVLGDILSLALPEQERDSSQIISVVMLAKSLSEETASMGASIWDTLIKIEKDNLYDVELLKQAKAFKRKFIESQHNKYEYKEIAQAWQKWKVSRPR